MGRDHEKGVSLAAARGGRVSSRFLRRVAGVLCCVPGGGLRRVSGPARTVRRLSVDRRRRVTRAHVTRQMTARGGD